MPNLHYRPEFIKPHLGHARKSQLVQLVVNLHDMAPKEEVASIGQQSPLLPERVEEVLECRERNNGIYLDYLYGRHVDVFLEIENEFVYVYFTDQTPLVREDVCALLQYLSLPKGSLRRSQAPAK